MIISREEITDMDTKKELKKVLLNRATEDAFIAHKGQYYGTEPYIYHPLRVANNFTDDSEDTLRIIGLLHDTLEDNPRYMEYRLNTENYPDQVIMAVRILTRDKDQNYQDYINEIKKNKYAVRVKLADLHDNMMSYIRLNDKKSEDYERFSKYRKAFWELKECLKPLPSMEDIFNGFNFQF